MQKFKPVNAKFFLLVCSVILVLGACTNSSLSSPNDGGTHDQSADDSKNLEQALLVYMALSDGNFGTQEERDALFQLEDKLTKIVEDRKVGLFDGNEFGGGECTYYMYGPSADALEQAVIPAVKSFGPKKGSYYIKRYGSVEDENAKEVRVDL